MDSFYVTLLSGSSLEYYPENSLSKFTVNLPYTLSLNENWVVGVTNFAHTHTKTVDLPKIEFNKNERINLNETIINILGAYPIFLNQIKNQHFFDRYALGFKLNANIYTKGPIVQINMLTKNPQIRCNKLYTPITLFDEIFSQIDKENWVKEINSLKENLNNLQIKPEYTQFITKIPARTLKKQTGYMLIYSDIIKPRIIGNTMARVLTMYPMITKTDTYQAIDIVNIQYCPIEKFSISNINILITNEEGEQINFEDGFFNTSIVLHFRKGI